MKDTLQRFQSSLQIAFSLIVGLAALVAVLAVTIAATMPSDAAGGFWYCEEMVGGAAHRDWDDPDEGGSGPFYKVDYPDPKHSDGVFIGAACHGGGEPNGQGETHTAHVQ